MLLECHVFQKCWASPRSGTAVFWGFLKEFGFPHMDSSPTHQRSVSSQLSVLRITSPPQKRLSTHPTVSFPTFASPIPMFLLDADHNLYLFCVFTCVGTSSPPHCKLRKAGTYLFYNIVFLLSNIVPSSMAVFNKYLLNERFSLFQWK